MNASQSFYIFKSDVLIAFFCASQELYCFFSLSIYRNVFSHRHVFLQKFQNDRLLVAYWVETNILHLIYIGKKVLRINCVVWYHQVKHNTIAGVRWLGADWLHTHKHRFAQEKWASRSGMSLPQLRLFFLTADCIITWVWYI